MSRDLERLIESLTTDISCYGDLGCTVSHVLESLGTFYQDASPQNDGFSQYSEPASTENRLLWSKAWDWLRVRKDISIGANRKWNHLPLSDILAVPDPDVQDTSADAPSDAPKDTAVEVSDDVPLPKTQEKAPLRKDLPRKRPRIYVSEDRMWESIAGHAPDYRRVPRLEWMALVGIASTKQQGILQGDLGRLVGQDKRSLPKRTDALAEKGYISKRTTLVRGTKTSKLWLTRFAPALPTDPTKIAGMSTTVDMSRDVLARDLEPVPWRDRWTGTSVDYISLAQTIMAIVKAYRIIRYHDLRCKLGILGLRWQMKVAAKTCRFFVQTGAIQYVGATLSGKLFKDCLKYDHDLTHEDWAAYLATGKQKSPSFNSLENEGLHVVEERNSSNALSEATSANLTSGSHPKKRISSRATWAADKPLTTTVFDNISHAGISGLSNKQIADCTLGASFRRYLSSISSTLAIPTLQPKHLGQFQVVSEMHRKGKSQQYRYFAPQTQTAVESVPDEGSKQPAEASGDHPMTDAVPTGDTLQTLGSLFAHPTVLPDAVRAAKGLTAVAQGPGKSTTSALKRKAEVLGSPKPSESRGIGSRRTKRARISEPNHNVAVDDEDAPQRSNIDVDPLPSTRMSTRRGTRNRSVADTKPASMIITLKVSPKALAEAMRPKQKDAEDDLPVQSEQAENKEGDETNIHATLELAVVADKTSKNAIVDQEANEKRPIPGEKEGPIVVGQTPQDQETATDSVNVTEKDSADEAPAKRGGRRKKGAAKKSRGARDGVFKCEKCGGTWKNDVGIKYHIEKSRTTCNPNFVPPTIGPLEPVGRSSALVRHAAKQKETQPHQASSKAAEGNRDAAEGEGGAASLQMSEKSDSVLFDNTHQKDSSVCSVDTPSRGRGTRTSRLRRTNASSETRFGARSRMNGQRMTPKSSSTLRPPIVVGKITIGGLIDDPAVGVRDMPAEHSQTISKQLQMSTDRRGKPHIDTGEANDHVSSPPSKEPRKDTQHAGTEAPQTPAINTSTLSDSQTVRTSINGKGIQTMAESDRMENVLLQILQANGGVFPGGRSVWYAVLAVWEWAFPPEPAPAHQSYKTALTKLAKRKQVVVSSHAFKDSRGMMANYQLLRIPGVEASSPAGTMMKAKIIEAHPKPYTPPAFTPKNGLPEEDSNTAQPVFSSRRKLVQGIEVLDAPFYAKKAANETQPTSQGGTTQTPRKRKRRMVTREQITHAEDEGPDGTRRRDIFRFFMDNNDSADHGLGLSGSSADGKVGSATRLVFLSPNTYLDEDVPEDVRRALLPPDHPVPAPTYPAPGVEGQVASDYEVVFTEPEVISGQNGTWPMPDNLFLETKDRSWTTSGWMPDSRWFLRENLPQNLDEMVKWRGRPRTRFPNSSRYSVFAEQVDACFDWELSTEGMKLMLAESIAPDYIFINIGIYDLPGEWANPPLEWNPTCQLQPSAHFAIQISEQGTAATDHLWGGDLGRQRRRKRRQTKPITDTKDLVVGIDLKVRSLMVLPKEADLREASKRSIGLDETNETMLIAAFVATRTLLGGADRVIEWGLMMTLFPDMALSAMRRFWSKARKDRKTFINQLTERFQIRFISAYENNEFPPIDYENYGDYEWARLIRWTAGLIEDSVELPASKADMEHDYALASAWTDVDNWRDDYHNFQMSVFNRYEAATSRPATSFVDRGDKSTQGHDLVTAMSWIRSLCYTPSARYPPQDIRKKMASIAGGDEGRIQILLEQAVEILQGQGVITDSKLKALEGRPYRLTETFLPRFTKWTHETKFLDAARFKSRLDASFRRGEKIRIPYVLKDGEVMAMMNLQASGRVSVTTVDVPSIPLGFDPGNYESRKYPKSYYNFGLEIARTDAYIYDEDLEIIRQVKDNKPPREAPNRAVPLWSDFFGQLDIERWSQVLGAVAFVVATRGPLDVPAVCSVLKPYLQEFEVGMVFEWGKRNGVLKGLTYGTSCTVDEWWWLLVGRQRTAAA